MKQVAILGASGYTGREVQRLLRNHPGMQLAQAMTARADAPAAAGELPVDPDVAPLALDLLEEIDGVFVCAPHGAAAPLVAAALERDCKVVDLSADFRLRDPALYERTYGKPHAAPALLETAVYGLTEHRRTQVARASLVANPGCYPTSILLPLLPLLGAGDLLDPQAAIVADAKSGVSGAGKTPTDRTHFGSVHENFLAYAVGNHRHTPEIHQEAGTGRILFVPHLLPVFRGILTTLYLRPARGVDAARVRACLAAAYADEPFVRVYDRGLPELDRVQHTNRCDLAVAQVQDHVVVVAAIDNLVKGAAGQAIQNMNLMLGLAETAGLPA
jgi:N-acetyl-gamma-glutamyl-phosphate reductase